MTKNDLTKLYKPVEYTITNNRSEKAYTVNLDKLFKHIDEQLTLEMLGSQQKMRRVFRRWLKQNGKLTDKHTARNLLWQFEINDFDFDYEKIKDKLQRSIRDKARAHIESRTALRLGKHIKPKNKLEQRSAGEGEVWLETNYNQELSIATPRGLTYGERLELVHRLQDALAGFVLGKRYTHKTKYGHYTYNYQDDVANRWYNKTFNKEEDR